MPSCRAARRLWFYTVPRTSAQLLLRIVGQLRFADQPELGYRRDGNVEACRRPVSHRSSRLGLPQTFFRMASPWIGTSFFGLTRPESIFIWVNCLARMLSTCLYSASTDTNPVGIGFVDVCFFITDPSFQVRPKNVEESALYELILKQIPEREHILLDISEQFIFIRKEG